jgi:hypothetical protein
MELYKYLLVTFYYNTFIKLNLELMRKLFLLIFASICFVALHAQTPVNDSLKEYTGKYKFPEGNPVPEVTISIQNGVLFGSSAQGSSELKRIEKDIFEVVAYSGIATFKRNEQAKVVGIKIEVEDTIMEGTKSEEAIFQPDQYKLSMPGR